MSLVGAAMRIIFTKLVRGRTMAGQAVLNAPVEPLVEVLRQQVPVISVYTGVHKGDVTGRELTSLNNGSIELVYQAYLPAGDDTAEDLNLQRAGAALGIDLLVRQISVALSTGSKPWIDLWKFLVAGYGDFDSRPILIELETGLRVPCREVSMACRTIPEPGIGIALNPFWAGFDAALRADPDPGLNVLADMFRDLIVEPTGLATWEQVQAAAGLSDAAIQAIGLAPVDPTEEGEPAELSGIEINPADLTVVVPPTLSGS
ncbi:hypothetical protein [Microvirga brassicacearum]|uniref:Uncharacterized protein n=1 Tax=Microvirga brassicacearum TaxID=2580413 RepID=A0A5N3PH40_9HYPH|nr:hypothetical protein [Microvirga brassicacearum]KAB0269062.1 hypothetical protein FEZ63_02845 [Microvirga brassicacearum]